MRVALIALAALMASPTVAAECLTYVADGIGVLSFKPGLPADTVEVRWADGSVEQCGIDVEDHSGGDLTCPSGHSGSFANDKVEDKVVAFDWVDHTWTQKCD